MNKKSLLSAFLSLLLLFMLLLALCLAVPVHAELVWDIQIVDENASGIGYGYCPIVVDSDDNPHIAYSGAPQARYASWNGSGWSIQQIEYADANDLALDTNDIPHILFGSLAYASWTGKEWDIQTVTTDHTVFASLALDSSGNPHAAYIVGGELKYASRNGSNWIIQTVAMDNNLPDISPRLSLALDSNNTPHIMYYNKSSYVDDKGISTWSVNIKLAIWKNSRWNIETILASSNLVEFGNMVLDSKGFPHFLVTHYLYDESSDTSIQTIEYVRWDGSAWNTQTAASDVNLATIGFLSLGPNDYPHIVYFAGGVKYTRWTGTAWESQTVDPDREVTGIPVCYLAVDSNGNPHITYLKVPPGAFFNSRILHLMYATATIPASEPTQPPSPTPPASLLLVSAAVIIGAVAAVVYVWKKKTQSVSK